MSEIKARYKWTYIKGREADYPELYLLHTGAGDRIKVEVKRSEAMVRLSADTRLGQHVQSVIRNGVILREKDLNTGKYLNLDEHFQDLRIEFSSLPDSQVLRFIGGNYEILTEFLGNVHYREKKPDFRGNDVAGFIRSLLYYPKKIGRFFRSLIQAMRGWPSLWDYFDAALISWSAWSVYQMNFNLLQTGALTAFLSLATGMFDWFFRKKDPYLIKVVLFFLPGMLLAWVGYRLQ